MLMSNAEFNIAPYGTFVGGVTFLLNYYGTIDQAGMDALNKFKVLSPHPWAVFNVTSFWQYSQNATDGPSGNVYLANTFVQREHLNDDFSNYMLSVMTKKPSAEYPTHGCTGTHLGGMFILYCKSKLFAIVLFLLFLVMFIGKKMHGLKVHNCK